MNLSPVFHFAPLGDLTLPWVCCFLALLQLGRIMAYFFYIRGLHSLVGHLSSYLAPDSQHETPIRTVTILSRLCSLHVLTHFTHLINTMFLAYNSLERPPIPDHNSASPESLMSHCLIIPLSFSPLPLPLPF